MDHTTNCAEPLAPEMRWHGSYTFGDALEVAGSGHVVTTAELHHEGTITLTSRVTGSLGLGLQVGVVVLLYDGCDAPEWICTVPPFRFALVSQAGLRGELISRFEGTLDADLVPSARYLVVKHYLAPNDAWDDVKPWLITAQAPGSGFSAVREVARELR